VIINDCVNLDAVAVKRKFETINSKQVNIAAVDNIIVRCVDDEASDDRGEINSHVQFVGRRRCKLDTASSQKGE